MADVERALEQFGLSSNEVKIYLALNDHGSCKAGRVARLAKIERSSCYNSLKSLTERGLVSYVLIGRVKWFQAAGPKRLLDYVHEQEDAIHDILPVLDARHKASKIEGQVRLFKGTKGVKSIFLDIIRTGGHNLVFGSEGQFSKNLPEFLPQFLRMKKEKGIKTKLIARVGRKEKDTCDSEHRYLAVAQSPAVTNIYGNKIAIIIWTNEPEGIIIENAAAAKAYKSYFDVLWRYAKK